MVDDEICVHGDTQFTAFFLMGDMAGIAMIHLDFFAYWSVFGSQPLSCTQNCIDLSD
jgi:hypothetical protein